MTSPASAQTPPALPLVELQGYGLLLRPLREEDAPALVRNAEDEDVLAYTTIPTPYTEVMALDWIDQAQSTQHGQTCWAIEMAEHPGRYAGSIDLRPIATAEVPTASFGYLCAPWARRNAVVTRAVQVASDYAFERGYQCLIICCLASNVGSRKVAEHCGFRPGTPPTFQQDHRGTSVDHLRFELRCDEPRPWRAA